MPLATGDVWGVHDIEVEPNDDLNIWGPLTYSTGVRFQFLLIHFRGLRGVGVIG